MITNKTSLHAYVPAPLMTVVDILRFEKGPQDLPHSSRLLIAFLASYTLARTVVACFTMPAEMAVLVGVIDAALLGLIVAAVLWVRRLGARAAQTLMGCFAAGSAVSLLTILAYTVVSLSPVPRLLFGIGHALTFPLIAWNLAVNAHIFREALSAGLTRGFALALVYLVILWQITEHLVEVARS
jgi:hypothetical protein